MHLPRSGGALQPRTSSAAAQLRAPLSGAAGRGRTAQAAASATTSGSSDGTAPVRGRGEESQNGAAPSPLPPGAEGLPRRQKRGGRRLNREDVHGGQYRIRQQSDWVEPWITQDIPEERLPRLEGRHPPQTTPDARAGFTPQHK